MPTLSCRAHGTPLAGPGVYFRLLLLGYLLGIDSERGIALTVSDSLGLRRFLGYELRQSRPDHSTISRTRRRISLETHELVFGWVLERLREASLANGKTVPVEATMPLANAELRTLRRKDSQERYREFVEGLAAAGVPTPTFAELAAFDCKRNGKTLSNQEWESSTDPNEPVAKMKDGTKHLAHKAEKPVDLEGGGAGGRHSAGSGPSRHRHAGSDAGGAGRSASGGSGAGGGELLNAYFSR